MECITFGVFHPEISSCKCRERTTLYKSSRSEPKISKQFWCVFRRRVAGDASRADRRKSYDHNSAVLESSGSLTASRDWRLSSHLTSIPSLPVLLSLPANEDRSFFPVFRLPV